MNTDLALLSWLLLFEQESDASGIELDTDRTKRKQKALVCACCGAKITFEESRIEVNNGHEHSFFNPHGVVFLIGCFDEAPGCQPTSPSSSEFSWFPGYQWVIVGCFQCQTHLGWCYTRHGTAAFYGLILNRLKRSETDEDQG